MLNAMIEGIDDQKNLDQVNNKNKEKELSQKYQNMLDEKLNKEKDIRNLCDMIKDLNIAQINLNKDVESLGITKEDKANEKWTLQKQNEK